MSQDGHPVKNVRLYIDREVWWEGRETHLFGDQGAWRVLSPAGELIFCSPRSAGYLRRHDDDYDEDEDDEDED